MTPTNDFDIRILSDYSSSDLEILMDALAYTSFHVKHWTPESPVRKDAGRIDIWCYRLRDAIKEAKHREQLENDMVREMKGLNDEINNSLNQK